MSVCAGFEAASYQAAACADGRPFCHRPPSTTWEQLKAHFAAPNRELYAQLAEDRRTAAAPPEERPFEPFDEEKECVSWGPSYCV